MIKEYDKLYKKTATGAIQVWWMEQLGGSYRSNSCQKDSDKIVTTEWTLVSGKNIGKKNETSDEEQAKSEILSEYKKKLAQGNYNESIDDIDSDNYFKPMLAKSLADYMPTDKEFEKEQIYSQPKLDGCLSGSTLIDTDKGILSLEEIFSSDEEIKVLSYNERRKEKEYKRILNKMKDLDDIKDKNIEWFEIELENNIKLKVTGNHLIYLPKLECYRRADELSENDILLII
jgi:hypothetical protein